MVFIGGWSNGRCLVLLFQIKAVREEPRDDAEVERKEEREIDKVFDDSSSEGEDKELTESGKEGQEGTLKFWGSVC